MITSSRKLRALLCRNLLTKTSRALYLKDDQYVTSDVVFGVKDSLMVDLGKVDGKMADKYRVAEGTALMTYDFVLVSEKESSDLRNQRSQQALEKLGRKVKILNGLPVPDVD